MATKTNTGAGFGTVVAGAAAVLALLMVVSVVSRLGDDDQAFVDFEGTWSPDRAMIATITIGGEPELTVSIQRDEAARVGIRRPAFKGQTVRMVITPVSDPGTVSCSITINEQVADEDQADGMEECFVEAVVP